MVRLFRERHAERAGCQVEVGMQVSEGREVVADDDEVHQFLHVDVVGEDRRRAVERELPDLERRRQGRLRDRPRTSRRSSACRRAARRRRSARRGPADARATTDAADGGQCTAARLRMPLNRRRVRLSTFPPPSVPGIRRRPARRAPRAAPRVRSCSAFPPSASRAR